MARVGGMSEPRRPRSESVIDEFLDENQHDPPARLGAQSTAVRRQGSSRPLEGRDISRRLRNYRIDAPCLFDGRVDGERFRA